MNVRTFTNEVPQWLGASLEDFEREFTYPLGENTRFRISHGRDYLRFFRAMGEAACVVAEKDGKVLGTLCGAIQLLTMPDGSTKKALYVGDLKITAGARGTRVLISLARALEQWARPRAQAAYSVVMDGTDVTPASYSGRAGIPRFAEVANLVVLRMSTPPVVESTEVESLVNGLSSRGDDGVGITKALRESGVIFHAAGRPALRSSRDPRWLALPGGAGVCRLENTQLAKRLLLLDGSEIEADHLSCFSFQHPEAGFALITGAAQLSARDRKPALFVALPSGNSGALVDLLDTRGFEVTKSTATVFATGLPSGVPWLVNTAEI